MSAQLNSNRTRVADGYFKVIGIRGKVPWEFMVSMYSKCNCSHLILLLERLFKRRRIPNGAKFLEGLILKPTSNKKKHWLCCWIIECVVKSIVKCIVRSLNVLLDYSMRCKIMVRCFWSQNVVCSVIEGVVQL